MQKNAEFDQIMQQASLEAVDFRLSLANTGVEFTWAMITQGAPFHDHQMWSLSPPYDRPASNDLVPLCINPRVIGRMKYTHPSYAIQDVTHLQPKVTVQGKEYLEMRMIQLKDN
jgi:hypothetical protein